MKEVNMGALMQLKGARHRLTAQQYRTLRGQVLAGDADGAMRGLRKLLLLQSSNAIKKITEYCKLFHVKHFSGGIYMFLTKEQCRRRLLKKIIFCIKAAAFEFAVMGYFALLYAIVN